MRLLLSAVWCGVWAGVVCCGFEARAALIAYEGFNYPNAGASVVGQVDAGPNASFGWSAGWADNTAQTNTSTQGPVYVNATGLTYSKGGNPLLVSGGKVEQTDQDTYLPFRTLAATVGGTGDLSASQSTVWVSFLVQAYGRSNTTPAMDPTVGLPNNYLLWGTSTGLNSASAPSASNATYVGGSRSSGNAISGGTGGANVPNFTGTGATLNGDVHLIVQRITFGAGSTGSNMLVDAWLDPTPGLDPSTNPGSFTSTLSGNTSANLLFAGLLFRGDESGQGAYDEIRIGDTALDVMPVPEPTSIATTLFGLAAFGLIRSWRRVDRRHVGGC